MLSDLLERYGDAYLVLAFFALPALGFVLSGGTRPPATTASAVLLWGLVVHHSAFVVLSVLVG